MTTLTAGSTANFSLSGRQVLTLTADNNTTGTIKRTQYVESSSSKTDTLGPPATNRTYGPFGHETDIELTCTYGSFEYDVTGTSLVTAETDPVTGGIEISVPLSLPRNRVVLLGDSLVENGNTSTATTAAYTARAIGQLGAALIDQRIDVVADKGVSGNTIAQMLARFDADVATNSPDWVALIGSSNDIDNDRTAVDIFADIISIFKKTVALKAQLVFFNTSAGGFGTEARHNEWCKLHYMCAELHASAVGQFFYQPMYYGAVDNSTTNNSKYAVAKTGILYDSRHPSALGAHTVYGQVFKNFFDQIQPVPFTPSAASGRIATSGDQDSVVQNSWFAAAGGGLGAGITGSLPTNFDGGRTGTIAAVGSLEDRTDFGPGRFLKLDISGATALTDAVTITNTAGNNAGVLTALIGKTVVCELDIEAMASSGTIGQLELSLKALTSASATLFTATANQIVGVEYLGITSFTGRLRTPPFVVPATADRPLFGLKVGTSVGGAAVVKLGGLRVFVKI